jgi:glutathione S-transferase
MGTTDDHHHHRLRTVTGSRQRAGAGLAAILERDQPWYAQRLRVLEASIRSRLDHLSRRLGDADWLDGAFSAGDLLMVTVLRRSQLSGMLADYPNLAAYVARGEARPAYKRAFAAQLAVFTNASEGTLNRGINEVRGSTG